MCRKCGATDMSHWSDDAACAEIGIEAFFPELESDGNNRDYKPAKQICMGCPVLGECLTYVMKVEPDGLPSKSRHGVWGGMAPAQRAKLSDEIISWKVERAVKTGRESVTNLECGECGEVYMMVGSVAIRLARKLTGKFPVNGKCPTCERKVLV